MGFMSKYIIGCTADLNVRAVYFARYDKTLSREVPTGLPIMFLRDFGMEKAAEELVELANKWK